MTHAADRHVGGYCLGMRQRLGLAAAVLGDRAEGLPSLRSASLVAVELAFA